MEEIPCLDGYLLDPRSPLADGHHALNHYLLRVEEAGWAAALKEINGIRDKGRKLLVWRALIERFGWLRDHNPETACLSPLRGLAERIEKWTLSLGEADLIELLERTAEVAGFATPYPPVPHLMAHIAKNGLTPALSAAIRRFRERVWDQGYTVNQTSLQLFRSRMDMLAWRDEWSPVDLKRCWSEQIRADYRAMQGPERRNWRRLLHSIDGDEGQRPAPRWLSESRTLVETIGAPAFRAWLLRWFEPLRAGQTQRLSREGSYLLRAFIWLAADFRDPELLARTAEICDVEFKPKSNGQKVIRAAAEAAGRPDPTERPLAPPPSLDSLISRALASVLAPGSSLFGAELSERIQADGDIVYVRGDLDRYEVHIATGAVFRASDGRRVHVRAAAARLGAGAVANFAGVADLLGQILMLAGDAKHAATFAVTDERMDAAT